MMMPEFRDDEGGEGGEASQREGLPCALDVPEADRPVATQGDQPAPIRAEGCGEHRAFMAFEPRANLARCQVINPDVIAVSNRKDGGCGVEGREASAGEMTDLPGL